MHSNIASYTNILKSLNVNNMSSFNQQQQQQQQDFPPLKYTTQTSKHGANENTPLNQIQKLSTESEQHASQKSHIKLSSDGHISNVPSNMLLDQFGMLGLILMLSRKDDTSDEDQNIAVMLGKGNTVRSLLQQSVSCFSKQYYQSIFLDPPNANPLDYQQSMHLIGAPLKMPHEYFGVYSRIKEKLMHIDVLFDNCKEDILFFLFYTCCQDELQMRAAANLHLRQWLFHRSLKLWIKAVYQSSSPNEMNYTQLRPMEDSTDASHMNLYFVFDPNAWEIKKMILE